MAMKPMVKIVSTMVANRKPAEAPVPLPKPTAMGTLKLIAVMGAAFATAMNRTPKRPTAPALSRASSFGLTW